VLKNKESETDLTFVKGKRFIQQTDLIGSKFTKKHHKMVESSKDFASFKIIFFGFT